MAVEQRTVAGDEGDLRLDRWFQRHFPGLGHGRLQKLLRTGQVRVDGRRARGDLRLAPGQVVRVPPLPGPAEVQPRPSTTSSPQDADMLRSLVIHDDPLLLVLNKPPGLAVQGGTGTHRHIDGMLDALVQDGERPRLVHRLDRDTSGLLVLARTASAAAKLGQLFRQHEVDKLYWALVVGRPGERAGRIEGRLAKQVIGDREKVGLDEAGRRSSTEFRTIAVAGRVATWLGLRPETGRTHQLRAHCALIGVPILGDGKYGGQGARLAGAPQGLMLHAREIRFPHPDGGLVHVTAPVSKVFRVGMDVLGFEPDAGLPGATLAGFDL